MEFNENTLNLPFRVLIQFQFTFSGITVSIFSITNKKQNNGCESEFANAMTC